MSFEHRMIIFHCPEVTRFIHSPTEGLHGCFQVLAVMNKAAIKICVKDFDVHTFQFIWVNTNGHYFWIIWLQYI